jgi:pyruvate/2-oxoglutarate dehydrogenase complex dihydrolipoamide acyltransferase (E2) component
MPQLGMAQDAGLIIAWHKAPGDTVAADDVLMEVETDKATMEVPAGRSGVLAAILADAGAEVPVGNVIAVIAATAEEAAAHGGRAASAAPAPATPPAPPEPTAIAAPPAATASAASPTTTAGEAAPTEPARSAAGHQPPASAPALPAVAERARDGRILATPKARRLAAERGIDLGALLSAGATEPIMVADLDRATPAPAATTAAAPAAALSTLGAFAERAAFDALLAIADPAADRTTALAAFAAGAWRKATGASSVRVAAERIGMAPVRLLDPDRRGLSELAGTAGDGPSDLSVVDLTSTRLTAYRPAGGQACLVVTSDGARLGFALAFDEAALPLAAAALFLDSLAARVEDPIRHIL